MGELVHEIDDDDLDAYRALIEQQTILEMRMMQLQTYLEEKYLAGAEYDDGEFYIDWAKGAIYLWE